MTLEDFSQSRLLLVVFMCNHCPYVQAILPRLNALVDSFEESDLACIGINSNDAKAYPEDSFIAMKALPVAFDYLHDPSQETARAYDAVCTPDFFLFDASRALRYRGRLDDAWQDESAVTEESLRMAIESLLSDAAPDGMIPSVPSQGCSIKWKPV